MCGLGFRVKGSEFHGKGFRGLGTSVNGHFFLKVYGLGCSDQAVEF